MQPVPPRNARTIRLMIDRPQPIISNSKKKKAPLKPSIKSKPMPKILQDKPGLPKPRLISQGGIGNKEVNPIYRNQGF
jgi:hypothetical protein